MSTYDISTTMACRWYLILMTIDFIQAQNPFGGDFPGDPFLDLSSGITTPTNQKSIHSDQECVSHGQLAGAIIGTLLLSALIAFLTWMIYLRQKLQELQSYEIHEKKHVHKSTKHQSAVSSHPNRKQYVNDEADNYRDNALPLDATDYKFGTFPFRQSQTPSVNGHYNQTDWLNRISTSFRSATLDKDTEMLDIELLNPTFCGLNFSITGNMRAGIFVKEILDKETSTGHLKLNSSDQLKTGDRIVALTVCFESIVYEDALTILSYASPYPVILRVQRPIRSTKIDLITEKRSATNKVKWRDDYEHYDNDTSVNPSLTQPNRLATITTDTKSIPTTTQHRPSSSKKTRTNKSSSTNKGNKLKSSSNPSGTKPKRSNTDIKTHRNKPPNPMILTSTGLSAKQIEKMPTPPISTNKTTMKSVTNAVISYLHYRGANGGHATDVTNNSEATLMPYYDSPYDYYAANASHSHLNKNNNNSLSTESLTGMTSVYTVQVPSLSPERTTIDTGRGERSLSSPTRILPMTIQRVNDHKDISLQNIDTCV